MPGARSASTGAVYLQRFSVIWEISVPISRYDQLYTRLEKAFLDQVPIFQNSAAAPAAAPAPGGYICGWRLRLRLASGPAANIRGFFDILALYTIEINQAQPFLRPVRP